MYAKLVLRNARRSIKDYLLYLLTLTLCVGLFYAFVSLSSPNYQLIISEQFDLSRAYGALKRMAFFITVVLIFLIKYVNNYMIKRKKKEFALYTMIGMEQRKVALLFFTETLIMGELSIIIGIILGTLFSQVLTALIVPSVGQSFAISFSLYPDTVFMTVVFFTGIFGIIGFGNIKTIWKIKIIDMLNDSKKVEIQSVKSKGFYRSVGILSLLAFVVTVISVKRYLYLLPLSKYIVSQEKKSLMLMISICSFIFAIYTMFYYLSYLIIFIRKNLVKLKYKNTNLFLLGQLSSKLKTTSKLMATIALTLMISIIFLVLSTVMSEWTLGYLEKRAIFDLQIDTEYKDIYGQVKNIPHIDYTPVSDYLKENGYEMESSVEVELYFINEDDFFRRIKTDFPVLAVSLSDYNKLREMAGLHTIELKKHSFTTQWHSTATIEEINEFLLANDKLIVDNTTLELSNHSYFQGSIGEALYNKYVDVTYVLPDEVCSELAIADVQFYGNTKKDISYNDVETVESFIYERYYDVYDNFIEDSGRDIENYISVRLKTLETNNSTASSLMMKFLCIYTAIVLIIICLTVLSLQQLSDSFEHKERFNVLRKLGVDDKEIDKLITKQMGIWFGIPIAVALIGFAIFIYVFVQITLGEIMAYVGSNIFILSIGLSVGISIIILSIYFTITYLLFKRNVIK
ncbi:MAG: FtsX-like permease family protein [Clostridiaceae bacterium]